MHEQLPGGLRCLTMMYDWDVLMLIYDGDVLMGVLLEFLFGFVADDEMPLVIFHVAATALQPSIAGSCCQPSCLAFARKLSMLCIQLIDLCGETQVHIHCQFATICEL